ncbi:hypothetical protein FGO68_gene2589 [Halteria grandinella]|uniref:Uncharacterized protein n=1 Tax=Halteria grandinella TaxID=5974 RepID=A0A8J8T2T2_HALGN|nr:hypothetical protein FGO68_gene2589 [Halteria grandinella]
MNHFQIQKRPNYKGSADCHMIKREFEFIRDNRPMIINIEESSSQNMHSIGDENNRRCGTSLLKGATVSEQSLCSRVSAPAVRSRDVQQASDLSNIIKRDANLLNNSFSKNHPASINNACRKPPLNPQDQLQRKTRLQASRKCSFDSQLINHLRFKVQSLNHNPILQMENLIISRQMAEGNAYQSSPLRPPQNLSKSPRYIPRLSNRALSPVNIHNQTLRQISEPPGGASEKVLMFKQLQEKPIELSGIINLIQPEFILDGNSNLFRDVPRRIVFRDSSAESGRCQKNAQRHQVRVNFEEISGNPELNIISSLQLNSKTNWQGSMKQPTQLSHTKKASQNNLEQPNFQKLTQNQYGYISDPPIMQKGGHHISPDFNALYEVKVGIEPKYALTSETLNQKFVLKTPQIRLNHDPLNPSKFKVLQSVENDKTSNELKQAVLQSNNNNSSTNQSLRIGQSPLKLLNIMKVINNQHENVSQQNASLVDNIKIQEMIAEREGDLFEDEIEEFSQAKVPIQSKHITATQLVNLKR